MVADVVALIARRAGVCMVNLLLVEVGAPVEGSTRRATPRGRPGGVTRSPDSDRRWPPAPVVAPAGAAVGTFCPTRLGLCLMTLGQPMTCHVI